jgi:formylglycine-generating enzyme required for sulfatase activity
MTFVRGFCVDRWEISLVEHTSGEPLSPYYPADPLLLRAARLFWQLERWNVGDENARAMPLPELAVAQQQGWFVPRAVSIADRVPQGYLNYADATRVCKNAGKRLCSKQEWLIACRGAGQTKFPYGAAYEAGKCNVYRQYHPAYILHGNSSIGHRDPRLNLVVERGVDPLLRRTGATPSCASRWGESAIYDMVGNLDEWIADETGTFVGGFYARASKKGCDAQITEHSPDYYDYSTGTRCCRDAD